MLLLLLSSAPVIAQAAPAGTQRTELAAKKQIEAATNEVEFEAVLRLLQERAGAVEQQPEHGDELLALMRLAIHRLHVRVIAGGVTMESARALLAALIDVAEVLPARISRDELVLQTESLRALLGDWQQALTALRPLLDKADLRVRVLPQMLNICLQQRCISEAWPALAAIEQIDESNAEPLEVAQLRRLRVALFLAVGMNDDASRAMEAARSVVLPDEGPRAVDARLLLGCTEMDVQLAAERHDAARVVADRMLRESSLPRGIEARLKLGKALALLGTQRRDEAVPLLEAVAASGAASYASRALLELALLELADGAVPAAAARLAELRGKPMASCGEYELNALARLVLAEAANGAEVRTQLLGLRAQLLRAYRWSLQQWSAIPASAQGVAFLKLRVRRDLLSVLCAVTLQLDPGENGVVACVDYLLEAEAMGSTARSRGLVALDVAALRSSVVPRIGAMLFYLPAFSSSWLFVLTADRCTAHALLGDVQLRRDVRRLQTLVFAGPNGDAAVLQRAAAAVGDWCLPADVCARLDTCHELVVVGREFVEGLPFEAMPWQGSWLGCAKAISSVPSVTLLHAAIGEQVTPRRRGLAVLAAGAPAAVDVARYGVDDLSQHQPDLERLAAAVATEQVLRVSGATRADLLTGPGADARVVIVLAHGVVAPERGQPYGLALAAGEAATGVVFADEISSAAEVLFLGACGFGGGGVKPGEDGGHRAAGVLLQNGARVVVLADGQLGLDVTQRIAREWLAELARGSSVAEAMRCARVAVCAAGDVHPWFHAQLRVEGYGGLVVALPPAPPGARPGWWIAAGVAAVLAALSGWWWRLSRQSPAVLPPGSQAPLAAARSRR